MNKKTFHGIIFSGIGSFWWGVIGVLYFKTVSFVSPLELTIHRTIWTAFLLFFFISFNEMIFHFNSFSLWDQGLHYFPV